MEVSTEIIDKAKKRYKELQHKEITWRSFYNGYLEGYSAAKEIKK